MNDIINALFKQHDKKYQEIQIRILPNLKPETIIGVRMPKLRKYAKELIKNDYLKGTPFRALQNIIFFIFFIGFYCRNIDRMI